MKGILLAGGSGSRLYPVTLVASKQLQRVYDKPMIYYPLSTLLEAGIEEIAIITTRQDSLRFEQLLGDGKRFGCRFQYRTQDLPEGIAQAFVIMEDFIAGENVCLILGDNIFYGKTGFKDAVQHFQSGALIFGCEVAEPRRYGVLDLDADGKLRGIVEKPQTPPSSYAVPGFYIYDREVVERTKKIQPSKRGELEITDLNVSYIKDGKLKFELLSKEAYWMDVGTSSSLEKASERIRSMEEKQRVKIGCPEEAAFSRGLLSLAQLQEEISKMPDCEYREYLQGVTKRYIR
jgi:glucose-1-phosphate thymidylyltransferase